MYDIDRVPPDKTVNAFKQAKVKAAVAPFKALAFVELRKFFYYPSGRGREAYQDNLMSELF